MILFLLGQGSTWNTDHQRAFKPSVETIYILASLKGMEAHFTYYLTGDYHLICTAFNWTIKVCVKTLHLITSSQVCWFQEVRACFSTWRHRTAVYQTRAKKHKKTISVKNTFIIYFLLPSSHRRTEAAWDLSSTSTPNMMLKFSTEPWKESVSFFNLFPLLLIFTLTHRDVLYLKVNLVSFPGRHIKGVGFI